MKESRFFQTETVTRNRRIRASYDAARTTDENRKHWANADYFSADAVAQPQIRRTLRSRSRYEVANNSYARGIVSTLADYVVGTGPRLQMNSGIELVDREIERLFSNWAKAAGLSHKLYLMRKSQCESGEVFGLLANNPKLTPIQLDIRVLEADQVCTPMEFLYGNELVVDGIRFDEFGNPVVYYVLKRHPGSLRGYNTFGPNDYITVPAGQIIHLFRTDRPGQSRGVPELTPALPLFALLRRYTLAVLGSAEQAAIPAGVIYSDLPGEETVEPMDSVEIERGTYFTLPSGWKMGQIKAEQPTTVYGDFKREILNEIARCLCMPFNIAAGNSSEYNYASGRLDHQAFYQSINVDRGSIVDVVLEPVFNAWLNEAVLVEGYLPQAARTTNVILRHEWIWEGIEHVDPSKEAAAQATRLESNTTTLAVEYARVGLDWDQQLRQRAKELELMRELGIGIASKPPMPLGVEDDEDEDIEDEDA